MGFGAIITSGEKNNVLRDDLVDCITEVRVEQSLDEAAHFAIRFQEDISGGQPRVKEAPELGCGQLITIAVKTGDKILCLVRGPVTERESSAMLGGPGSWFEIRGQDRRIEMDRVCHRRPWTGLESVAAAEIFDKQEYRFDKKLIQKTTKFYGGRDTKEPTIETLNQRATDEAFLCQIARRNNMCFWIEYECPSNGAALSAGSLKVETIATLRSSPLRSDAELLLDNQPTKLAPKADVFLRVNVGKDECPNVTAFHITEDSERPSIFNGTAMDLLAGGKSAVNKVTSVKDPQQPLEKRGKRIDRCNFQREVCITTAGNIEELLRKVLSALTEAGWFIKATASTTAHMLGGVLQPHDDVTVVGLGEEDDGLYQVKAVTHVINAADHFMDLELRRNSLRGKAPAGG